MTLHIVDERTAFYKARTKNGSILMEPTIFASNQMLKNLNKFGIFDIPEELLYLADNQPNIHEHSLECLEPHIKRIVTRPWFDNTEKIFSRTLEDMDNNIDVWATKGGAALLLKWIKTNEMEISFDIETDYTIEDLAETYSALINRPSIPYSLERLMKLWFLFYGKKVSKSDCVTAGKFQEELLCGIYEDDFSARARQTYRLIKNVKANELISNPLMNSNNIFNKLLEELHLFINALENPSNEEIISGEYAIIKPNVEKFKFDMNQYQELFS